MPNNAHQQPTSTDITTISSSLYNRTTWKTIHALNSDHLPILLTIQTDNKHTIQTDNKHTIQPNRRSYTNYRKADWDKFTQDTEDAFTAIQPPTDIHDANKTFTNILYQAGKTHTSRKDTQHRHTPTTPHTQQNSTQKLDKQKHATRSQYTGVKQRDIHPHKHSQDRYLEGTHRKTMGSQTKTYWNTIYGLAHKRPTQQDNNSISFKNNTHINPKDIASAFNKQFVNTIPHKTNTTNRKITRKITTTQILRLYPTQIHITTEQVQTAIKSSKNNSSTGPDNINIKHLKHIGKLGLKYLTNIYNAALNDNMKIPHVWKLANIIPIPKPNKDINIGTSYRPISLLSVIEKKTYEKVILPYITQNIPNNTTRVQNQTFYKHSTTQHQQYCRNRFQPIHSTQ